MSQNPPENVVEVASHALFAVDDVVVTPRGIRGLAMPGEKFTITEVRPNGWYHLKPHREASGFLARHREISSANVNCAGTDASEKAL